MKRNSFFPFAFAAVAALVAAPVRGDDSDAVDMRVLRSGHIVVRGSIGPIDKLTFLIDTGASVTTVPSAPSSTARSISTSGAGC
jgi:predicted aspartyl protease